MVDDVQVLAIGDRGVAVKDLADAHNFIVDDFQLQGLPVASDEKKMVLMSSSFALRTELSRLIRIAGKPSNKHFRIASRNLGVDYSLTRRSTAVQRSRLSRAAARANRLGSVRKAGIAANKLANVARSSVASVATYGVGVVGVSDTSLTRLRACMHKAVFVRPQGRSTTADLEFVTPGSRSTADPAVPAMISPIYM